MESNSKSKYSNYAMIPNIIDDLDLSPQEFRLYYHIKRVAGENGKCWQSIKTLSEICHLSQNTIIKCKRSLESKGLIKIKEIYGEHGLCHEIEIVDIWDDNKKYSEEKYKPLKRDNACPSNEITLAPQTEPLKKTPLRRLNKEYLKDSRSEERALQNTISEIPDDQLEVYSEEENKLNNQTNGKYVAEFSEEENQNNNNFDLSWLKYNLRPLARAFLDDLGERYYPTKSERKLWYKILGEWLELKFTPDDIHNAISISRKAKLSIKGPQSITWALRDPGGGEPYIEQLGYQRLTK